VWFDDTMPGGMTAIDGWFDTSQKASGTKSLHIGYGAGAFSAGPGDADEPFHVLPGDRLVFYLLMNPCARPREVEISFAVYGYGWEGVYWGEALSGDESGKVSMGALPTSDGWVRMEVPASLINYLEGNSIYGLQIGKFGGEMWLDRFGRAGTPAVLTDFAADHASPQPTGSAITWTATGTGGVLPVQYRFERQDAGVWSEVQAYSSTNTYSWTPGTADAGDHSVRVSVRNAGAVNDFDDTRTLAMTITSGSGMLIAPRENRSMLGKGNTLLSRLRSKWNLAFGRDRSRALVSDGNAANPSMSSAAGPAIRPLSENNSLQRHSLYSPELSLLAETTTSTDPTPLIAYEYIWFAGQPAAQVETATGTTHFYFNDHLGTPVLQTNASGDVDWRVEYEPFGKVSSTRIGTSHHQSLRFPGQEFDDLDADHEYNIFRWYRSEWGRYTQTDEDEAAFDGNPYSYALDEPISTEDPLGLYACMYQISTHKMTCVPSNRRHPPFSSTNYVSGNNQSSTCPNCQNDPNRVSVAGHGPLPPGNYRISARNGHGHRRPLTSLTGPIPYNRDAFQTHGCPNPATCSQGCIAATTNATRNLFDRLMDLESPNTLMVLP
jgi:RHS repeat-associated protein